MKPTSKMQVLIVCVCVNCWNFWICLSLRVWLCCCKKAVVGVWGNKLLSANLFFSAVTYYSCVLCSQWVCLTTVFVFFSNPPAWKAPTHAKACWVEPDIYKARRRKRPAEKGIFNIYPKLRIVLCIRGPRGAHTCVVWAAGSGYGTSGIQPGIQSPHVALNLRKHL